MDQTGAHASAAENARRAHRTARRSLLALGGTAGAGLVALFTASPAQAKSGDPVKAGRAVDAGSGSTRLRASTSKTAFGITQNGVGNGLTVRAKGGHAIRAAAAARGRVGVLASHDATSTDPTGYAAAVLAAGQNNVGLRATTSTTAKNVPAVVATGSGGRGVAMLATGKALLDGDVFALNSLVGVRDPAGELAYTYTETGELPRHGKQGVVTLASGTAAVVLGAKFTAAVDMSTLAVQLTPVGAAMSGLYYEPTSTGFTIRGGSGSGKVAWSASAVRFLLTLNGAQASAKSAAHGSSALVASGGSRAAKVTSSGIAAPSRAVRPEVEGVVD